METFPAFFPLKGARVVIAGEGEAAEAKARLFEGSPAVVARVAVAEAEDPRVYDEAALIFIAFRDDAQTLRAVAAARSAPAPLNVVDHPELSDFHTPAIIDRGQVVAALGTAGASPVLASLLRGEIEARLAPGIGEIARLLGERRSQILAAYPDFAERRAFFRRALSGPAAQAAGDGDLDLAARHLDAAIAAPVARQGRVSFVEAPGQADLLSLRAVRALNVADIVVIGEGAQPIIATHGRRDAERWTDAPVDRLAEAAGRGDLIVVVDREPKSALAEVLSGLGVVVETLAPAPCP